MSRYRAAGSGGSCSGSSSGRRFRPPAGRQGDGFLYTLGPGEEEGGPRANGEVLDVDEGELALAEAVEEAVGLLGGGEAALEPHLRPGK